MPLIFLLLTASMHVFTQNYNNYNIEYSRKSTKYLVIADSLFKDGNSKSISYYKKAIDADSMNIDAKYKLAKIFHAKYILSQYDILLKSYSRLYATKTENYFLQCIDLCESYDQYKAFYYLGELYFLEQKFNLASYFLKEYINTVHDDSPGYKKAIEYYSKCQQLNKWHSQELTQPINALSNVNTSGNEENIHLSYDGQLIFFTRQYNKPIKNTLFTELVQEAFYSNVIGIDSANNWIFDKAKPMFQIPERTIQSVTISANKKELLCSACKKVRLKDSIIEDCDIYYTQFNGLEWDIPKPIQSINKINSWESDPCLSPDGNTLYFSSDGYGGYGGKDLYFTSRNNDGTWDSPVNMGPQLNTVNNERSPFIHYDNKTLFFSSNGHFGLGGYDLFYTYLENENWHKPTNMGLPFNNEDDNTFLCTDARSLTGYFTSSYYTEYGGFDINSFEIPQAFRSKPKMIINIKASSNKPIDYQPKLIIKDVFEGNKIQLTPSYNSDFYSAIIDIDKSIFILQVESSNYIYTNRLMQANSQYTLFELINLNPVEVGEIFEIEDLRFPNGSSELSKNSRLILNDFSDYLNKNRIKLAIYSNYYSITNGDNDELVAEQRFNNISNYLLMLGIAETRFEGKIIDQFVDKEENNERPDVYFKIISK